MASSTYLTTGIVLKRKDFREYDRLITLYTEEYGKVETIARGVRKIVSKLAGHLEPLSYSSFMLARGKRFDVLASSVRQSSFRMPQTNLLAFALASYFFEAVDRLTRANLPDKQLFALLLDYLHAIEATVEEGSRATAFQRVVITEYSLFQLLRHLGYLPAFDHCAVGNEPLSAQDRTFNIDAGGLVCTTHRTGTGQTYDLTPQTIAIFRLMSDDEREPLRLLNQQDAALRQVALVVNQLLTYHIGEPLRSAAFLTTWIAPH